jgi:hypothetical protein
MLDDLFNDAGGVPKVCLYLGKGKSAVYGYADGDNPGRISYRDVARLTEICSSTVAMEHLAGLIGCAIMPPPVPIDGADLTAMASRMAALAGEAMGAVITTISNDKTSPELPRLLDELADLARRLRIGLSEDGGEVP